MMTVYCYFEGWDAISSNSLTASTIAIGESKCKVCTLTRLPLEEE